MTDLEFYRATVDGQTIGHFIRAVFKIETEEDAARFYRGCVADIQQQIDAGQWKSRFSADAGARANIGWCFGEGMDTDKITMWVRATGASHPVFGQSMPSPERTVALGIALGSSSN